MPLVSGCGLVICLRQEGWRGGGGGLERGVRAQAFAGGPLERLAQVWKGGKACRWYPGMGERESSATDEGEEGDYRVTTTPTTTIPTTILCTLSSSPGGETITICLLMRFVQHNCPPQGSRGAAIAPVVPINTPLAEITQGETNGSFQFEFEFEFERKPRGGVCLSSTRTLSLTKEEPPPLLSKLLLPLPCLWLNKSR